MTLNPVATVREIVALGRKHGVRFAVAALVWELIEDVVLPLVSWKLGHPELIPLFLVLHFEPLVYPVFFWAFRTYDRLRGREPWDPDRPLVSTWGRSWAKVISHRLASVAIFWTVLASFKLPLWMLTVYAILMTGFKYVHERIWHDSSWGVSSDGTTVEVKRTVAKTLTYQCASAIFMAMVMKTVGPVNLKALGLYQLLAVAASFLVESLWSRTAWGIRPTSRRR